MHCQSCRCTQMQDKPWLLRTDEGVPCLESLIIPDLERSSLLRYLTGGHWLGRASCPEVIDVDLNDSLGLGKSRFQHDTPSISSMGNLVCSTSTVSALQPSKLLETEFSINDTLSQHGLHSYMNQAPGRDDHLGDISEGLASASQESIQPCVRTEIVGPSTLQPEDNGLGLPALGDPASVIGSSSILPYEAYQPPTNLSGLLDDGGFVDPFPGAQIPSFIDFGSTVGHDNASCLHSQLSPFLAMTDAQPITGLQALAEPKLEDGTGILPGLFNFPALSTNSSNWTFGSQLSIDTPLIPTPDQGSPFSVSPHMNSPLPSHSTHRLKGRRPFRCPHDDCDYTSNTLRDVQRHLGSRKHGESPKSFPCLVAGCNVLKDNSRRDNFIRHMETVHRQIVGRMKNGRKPSRATQEPV